jgi:hypothetical protein
MGRLSTEVHPVMYPHSPIEFKENASASFRPSSYPSENYDIEIFIMIKIKEIEFFTGREGEQGSHHGEQGCFMPCLLRLHPVLLRQRTSRDRLHSGHRQQCDRHGDQIRHNNRARSLRSIKENYSVKRRIKFEFTDIYVDDDGVEHYPLFTCALADALRNDGGMDVSFDAAELNGMLKGRSHP